MKKILKERVVGKWKYEYKNTKTARQTPNVRKQDKIIGPGLNGKNTKHEWLKNDEKQNDEIQINFM